jgi:HAMP domain-containing protein
MPTSHPSGKRKSTRARLGLRPRLVLFSWASLLFALIVGGGSAAYLLIRNEQASWRARLGEAGQGVAYDIADFISHAQDDLHALEYRAAPIPVSDLGLASLVLEQHDTFLEVVYFDPEGMLVAQAYRDQPVLAAQADLTALQWFTTARGGKSYVGEGEAPSAGEAYLVLAEPGTDGGVIAARVRMSALRQIVSRMDLAEGEAFVMDKAGRVLARPDATPVADDTVHESGLLSLLQDTQVHFAPECMDLRNRPAVCSGSPIPGTEWVAVASVPVADAQRPTTHALAAFGGALLLIGAVAALMNWWRLKVLVFQPVEALQRGAEALGRGELDHKVRVYRWDEIGARSSAMPFSWSRSTG